MKELAEYLRRRAAEEAECPYFTVQQHANKLRRWADEVEKLIEKQACVQVEFPKMQSATELAYQDGCKSRANGKTLESNPYQTPALRQEWAQGWHWGQEDLYSKGS